MKGKGGLKLERGEVGEDSGGGKERRKMGIHETSTVSTPKMQQIWHLGTTLKFVYRPSLSRDNILNCLG